MHINIYEWCCIFVVLILCGVAIWINTDTVDAWAIGAAAIGIAILSGGVSIWRRYTQRKHVKFAANEHVDACTRMNTDSDVSEPESRPPHEYIPVQSDSDSDIDDSHNPNHDIVPPGSDIVPPGSDIVPPGIDSDSVADIVPPRSDIDSTIDSTIDSDGDSDIDSVADSEADSEIAPPGIYILDNESVLGEQMPAAYIYPICDAFGQYKNKHYDRNRAEFIMGHKTDLATLGIRHAYNRLNGKLEISDQVFGKRVVRVIHPAYTSHTGIPDAKIFASLCKYVKDGYTPVSKADVQACLRELAPTYSPDVVRVHHVPGSLVDKMATQKDCVFWIPSNFNGAAYVNTNQTVNRVPDYTSSYVNGVAERLAADPGVAQFILNNAENITCTHKSIRGINSVRQLLAQCQSADTTKQLVFKNGFLALRHPANRLPSENTDLDVGKKICAAVANNLQHMRLLITRDVPIVGINRPLLQPLPNINADTDAIDNRYARVDMAYASIMPHNTVMPPGKKITSKYSRIMAILIIYSQLCILIHYAASVGKNIMLPPFGCGMFTNITPDNSLAIRLAHVTCQSHIGKMPKIYLVCTSAEYADIARADSSPLPASLSVSKRPRDNAADRVPTPRQDPGKYTPGLESSVYTADPDEKSTSDSDDGRTYITSNDDVTSSRDDVESLAETEITGDNVSVNGDTTDAETEGETDVEDERSGNDTTTEGAPEPDDETEDEDAGEYKDKGESEGKPDGESEDEDAGEYKDKGETEGETDSETEDEDAGEYKDKSGINPNGDDNKKEDDGTNFLEQFIRGAAKR